MSSAKFDKVKAIPADVKVPAEWGPNFHHSVGFAIDIGPSYTMSVFVDRRLPTFRSNERHKLFDEKDATVARCISCIGEHWSVRSEPLGAGKFGVIVYTAKGKALAAGTGAVESNGDVSCRFSTLYEGITQATNLSYEGGIKYNSATGGWEVSGGVKYTDPR